MAQLAENSVVIAFRDWQWRNLRPKRQSPDLFLSLEGNAEKKKGDAEVAFDDRFYIFEIKSTGATVKDEWTKKKILNGTSKANPKWAYRKVRRLLRVVGKLNPKSPFAGIAESLLNKSLACHHFLFWRHSILPNDPRGDFCIVPYIAGTKRLDGLSAPSVLPIGDHQVDEAMSHLDTYSFGSVKKEEFDSIQYQDISTLHPKLLSNKKARLITTDGGDHFWQYFGLKLADFQEYVNYLCGNVDEEINVIVTSKSGSVFSHVTRTTDLKSLVNAYALENRPAPTNSQLQKLATKKPPMPATPERKPKREKDIVKPSTEKKRKMKPAG